MPDATILIIDDVIETPLSAEGQKQLAEWYAQNFTPSPALQRPWRPYDIAEPRRPMTTTTPTIHGSLADYVAEQRKQRPDIKICLIAHTLAWATKLAREAGIKDGPDGIVCGPLGSLIGARVDLLILDQSFDKHLGEAWYQENVLGRLTEGAQIVRYAGPGET